MAQDKFDVIRCSALRYHVFWESIPNFSLAKLDLDFFDYQYDHLIIEHLPSSEIVGTYRLRKITPKTSFYSQTEFKIPIGLISHLGAVELGRACIMPQFRKGAVLGLLWRGIAHYLTMTQSHYLLGCSSIFTTHPKDVALVYSYFKLKKHLSSEWQFDPKPKYYLTHFDMWEIFFKNGLTQEQMERAEQLIPSLLKSYLKLGAQIISRPAHDKKFRCVDFLTIANVNDLFKTQAQRFFSRPTSDHNTPSLNPA
ncbi:MAG: GNAT family N-acyltransferase [Pseudobdellovibrionaceae bacterium]|nr:GNAT family N-acyltransferase [Pseudobdellovibrionaceae bacterium]